METNLLEILKIDSSRLTADIATKVVLKEPIFFEQLLCIMRTHNAPINWRAARVVEFCNNNSPTLFAAYANEIAEEFPSYKTDGLKRSLTKIFIPHLSILSAENAGILIETCFSYLNSPLEAIAVRVNCMQLLFSFTNIYPELAPELKTVIELKFPKNSESAAFCGRARMILKKLA